jgi:predicted short-subunit dehydrogenase-like oxidoreductase (DUF2520 family)
MPNLTHFDRRLIVIGAGNVASHLTPALFHLGYKVEVVFSRTYARAAELAAGCSAKASDQLPVDTGFSGIVLLCLSDTALTSLASAISFPNAMVAHTSGSLSLEVLDGCSPHTGVLYPLQTFSRSRPVHFSDLPFFIESRSPEARSCLQNLAQGLSSRVSFIQSDQRARLHLGAVFVSNFVNHLYRIADDLMHETGLSFEHLLPLIQETAAKVSVIAPASAQTGPAFRNDRIIIQKHLQMLENQPAVREIYQLLSDSIQQKTIRSVSEL